LKSSREPSWLQNARRYYSQVDAESTDPVTVFSADADEVSNETSGRPCVRLEPAFRSCRVIDSYKGELGTIHSEGVVPLVKYVMRVKNETIWTLSVRSVVRKHHALRRVDGGQWTFNTPFFWWQHLSGTLGGTPRLLGRVGPTKRVWFVKIEPGLDTPDILAAIAFMHRNWWRW